MIDAIRLMLSYDFTVRALIAGLLIAVCSALLGTTLVTKRFSMIGDGLSHIGFGTLALAAALRIAAPLFFSVPLVIIAAFVILKLDEHGKIKGDSALAMLSVGALAFGVVVLALANSSDAKLTGYMFGSILTLTSVDLYLSIALSVAVILLFIIFYRRIFAMTFDEQFAYATGIKTKIYNAAISVLTAVTIVIGMNLVGSMLISGLIIFPPLTAMMIFKRFKAVVVSSAVLAALNLFVGMTVAIACELPPGAVIICANACVFLIAWLAKIFFIKRHKN